MKVVHLLVSDALTAEWEPRFRSLKSSGLEPFPVQEVTELEYYLGDSDFGAALHIVDANATPPEKIAELAKRYPDKLAIVAGSVSGVAAQFTSALRAADVELLIVLDDFEDVRSEICRGMPRWLTRRWVLTELWPVLESRLGPLDDDDRQLVEWFLLDAPLAHKTADSSALSKAQLKSLNSLLAGAGLRESFEISGAIQLLLNCACITCVGFTPPQAGKMCGRKNLQLLTVWAVRVLGMESLHEVHRWSWEQVRAAAMSYVCGTKEAEVVPTAVPAMPSALSAWLASEHGMTFEQIAVSHAGAGSDEYQHFWRVLKKAMDGFLTALLWRELKHAERVADMKQEVWLAVHDKVQSPEFAELPLSVEGIESHLKHWKSLLASTFQNEISNFRKGLKRRQKLGEKVKRSAADVRRWHSGSRPSDELARNHELGAAIDSAMAQLPEEEREVAELCLGYGLTVAEVTEVLGVSARTVKRILARARETLQDPLRPFRADLQGG